MKSAWDEVQPNQIYQVFKSVPLTEEGKNGLLYLYQSIIGAQSLALYYALLGDLEDLHEHEFVHIDLLNALNVGLPDFLNARKRLEGMGLISVFVKEDPEFGRMFVYRLEEPLHPREFIKDQLYSFLLWDAVGERKFNQLVARFQPKTLDLTNYQEITSHFGAVYGRMNEEAFVKKSEQLEQIAKEYQVQQPETLALDLNALDWTFLIDFAQRKFIKPENFTPALRKQLVLYKNLYGYDELTLVNLMAEVVSLADGQVDVKALERNISRRNKHQMSKETTQTTELEQERRFNTLRQTGFSEADLEMITLSETVPPAEFLQAIKQEKHSFVTDSEQYLLKSLVERSPLSNSVINILMHYVLVIQQNSTLQANLVNKIATNWAELAIKSPEAAITHVRQLVKEAKEKANRPKPRGTYQNQKPIRKEVLPDWANEPQKEVKDTELEQKMQERLNEYLKRKEGDK